VNPHSHFIASGLGFDFSAVSASFGRVNNPSNQTKIMNEAIPPLPNAEPQPKTSALAIWSLVLGILSLMCFSIFAAIPGVICGHKALSKIKQSGGALSGHGLAVGGLVTGYLGIAWAVFFIPLLMAIAIPNFVKARETAQQNACINNLRQIDTAKHQWALENNKKETDTPTESDLLPYFRSHQWPQCPAGGTYTIGAVSNAPACSIPNHHLPVY
jgi:competence protein ComGC